MSILSNILTSYGDDTAKAIGKSIANEADDILSSKKMWQSIGDIIDNGAKGSSVRGSLKKAAFKAIDSGDDVAAKEIISNMPIVAHSSPHLDDLMKDKVGSYFQLTPANNVELVGGLPNDISFTSIINPEAAVKKASDKYTKLISPMDTGFSTGRGKTVKEWSDDLAKEIGGIADSTEIPDRKLLQDFVYKNQGENFDNLGEDITYAELAIPRDQARENLVNEFRSVGTGNDVLDKRTRGDIISDWAIKRLKNSKDRSREFDRIFLTGAPMLGGGAILSSLLNNNQGKES